MKIDKLNAWLSFSGNIAILLGLVALAIEINDNTAAVRAQELGALQEQDQARQLATIDPDFGAVYVKSLYRPHELTQSELVRLVHYLNFWLNNMERTYQAHVDGIIRQADWDRRLLDVPIFFGTPFGEVLWGELQGDYASLPGFVDAVDTALETSPVAPDDAWYLSLHEKVRALGQ